VSENEEPTSDGHGSSRSTYERHAALIEKLRRHGFFSYLGVLGFLIAVVGAWVSESRRIDVSKQQSTELRRLRITQSWQLINGATGNPGDGGRRLALQYLVSIEESLAGVNLEGAWLDSVQLPGAIMDNARMARVDLASANLRGAQMNNVVLTGANLRGAKLEHADLSDADLVGADLSYAHLEHANLYGADLTDAILVRTDLDSVHAADANLQNAYMYQAMLKGAVLLEANLAGVEAGLACLAGANLSGAQMDSGKFWMAHLTLADMRDASLLGADLVQSRLGGAVLEAADLENANFEDAQMGNVDLRRSSLIRTHMRGANLRSARLEHTLLAGTYLFGADLAGASLDSSYLICTNLQRTKLDSIDWNDSTEFSSVNVFDVLNAPDGFLERADSLGAVKRDMILWGWPESKANGSFVSDWTVFRDSVLSEVETMVRDVRYRNGVRDGSFGLPNRMPIHRKEREHLLEDLRTGRSEWGCGRTDR